jgi:hypothetical protein
VQLEGVQSLVSGTDFKNKVVVAVVLRVLVPLSVSVAPRSVAVPTRPRVAVWLAVPIEVVASVVGPVE